MCWQHNEKANNAIPRMGADDPITQKCLEEIEEWEEGSQNQKKKLSQGQFGPHLITKIAKELDRFAEVYPMRYGHPWHWTEAKPIFEQAMGLKPLNRKKRKSHTSGTYGTKS